ncbi:MAG TPA: M48 family metallopeptidase [Burkholderiales bacterium]|nr:M48 family metallopeptidase [Burkholderiales bacterium]
MNFFEHQALARRNSRMMVVLFLLAVVAVVSAVDCVIAAVYLGAADAPVHQVPASVYVWGALITAGTIFVVSLIHVTRLGGGGAVVAAMAGARRVASNSTDPLERRLVNIVEEMAIASGVRVPQVYIMDKESGINAFAAGWEVSNAVVAVTRGALDTLNRDELQGVVGHEFSHILNGDMRLNIRMLGVLAGIVFIGSVGAFGMRSAGEADDIRAAAVVFVIGLALFIVGYVGLFFGHLIKAAIARQREYLADASSVQFTRNPDGIAGALDQIRGAQKGALISARCAEDLSHMFFGESLRQRLGGLLATHPSLDARIKRVNPRFQPSTYRQRRPAQAAEPAPAEAAGFAGEAAPAGRRAGDAGAAWGRSPAESANLVGSVDAGKLDHAARLLASLPAPLREALREPDGASAAMVALLIAPKEDVMRQQLDAVARATTLAERVRGLLAHTSGLGLGFHLPVIDLALATIKPAPESTKRNVVAALEAAAYADRRVSLHEFVVLTLVRDQLAPRTKPGAVPSKRIAQLEGAAGTVLALMAHAGTRGDATGARQDALQAALRAGATIMGIKEAAAANAALNLDAARNALEALKELAPMQKAVLVKGLFAAVTADGTIRVAEAGLMRLVGAVLDCPLPPLLAEVDPASLQE